MVAEVSSVEQVVKGIQEVVVGSMGHCVDYVPMGLDPSSAVLVHVTSWHGTRIRHSAWVLSLQDFLSVVAPNIAITGAWMGDWPIMGGIVHVDG